MFLSYSFFYEKSSCKRRRIWSHRCNVRVHLRSGYCSADW